MPPYRQVMSIRQNHQLYHRDLLHQQQQLQLHILVMGFLRIEPLPNSSLVTSTIKYAFTHPSMDTTLTTTTSHPNTTTITSSGSSRPPPTAYPRSRSAKCFKIRDGIRRQHRH